MLPALGGCQIVEPAEKPEYLNLNCSQVLTPTACICNIHPSLKGSFWDNGEKEHQAYQRTLSLSDDEFEGLKELVSQLFGTHKLDLDGRFVEISDALMCCKKYIYKLPAAKILSIALEDNLQNTFLDDSAYGLNADCFTEKQLGGDFIGYDILGYDNDSFHSYLCNGLNSEISGRYSLETNDIGLIENSYPHVKEFAEFIYNKGEPVFWLPFAVYDHTKLLNP